MNLFKLWKKSKKIRMIMAAIPTITAVVSIYLIFFDVQVNADEIDVSEGYGIVYELEDDELIEASGDITALLQSCEKIANYMKNHHYTYDSTADRTPDRYDGPGNGSCCAAYVCWCLHDANIIQGQEHYCNVHAGHGDQHFPPDHVPDDGVWKLLYEDPNWQQVILTDKSQLLPGDIQIYKNGTSHTNIFAGKETREDGDEYLYWDAGWGGHGAFIGEKRTSSYVIGGYGYTCTYRHISMINE